MKTFTSILKQNSARWIFIFGLFAGLFFSSGEGIQLMPFPVSEHGGAARNVSISEENSKSYAFSVFNSRAFSALLKAKFQKVSNPYLSGERFSTEYSERNANFCPDATQKYRRSSFLHASPAADSRSNRAPPAI